VSEDSTVTNEQDLHQTSWLDNQFDRCSGVGQLKLIIITIV